MRTVHLYNAESPNGTVCGNHTEGHDITKVHESVNCTDCLK